MTEAEKTMVSILNSLNYLRVATPLKGSKEGKKVSGIEGWYIDVRYILRREQKN